LHGVNVQEGFIFFHMVQQPLVDYILPIIEASQLIGLFWTSDQPKAETCTWQHTTLSRDRHPCPWVGFETTIPGKWTAAYPRFKTARPLGLCHKTVECNLLWSWQRRDS